MRFLWQNFFIAPAKGVIMADEFKAPIEPEQQGEQAATDNLEAPVQDEFSIADSPAPPADEPVGNEIIPPVDEVLSKEKPPKPPKQPKPPKKPKPPREPKPPRPPKIPKTAKEKAKQKALIKRIGAIAAVIILLAAAVFGVWYYFIRSVPVNVTATLVLRGTVRDVVNATGKVEASQMVPIYAVQNDTVGEVLVKEGDSVIAGQNLVSLDGGGFVTTSIAGKVTNIAVQSGDKVTGKVQPLTTTPSITTPSTNPTTTTPPATDITTPTITTPTTSITQTQTSQTATLLMTVANMDPTYVVANVDETDISKIKIGQKTEMTLDAYPNKIIRGDVIEIGLVAAATQTGGTAFPVKIRVTEAKAIDLRIGMSADTDIIIRTRDDALRVPVTAVTTDGGKDATYIVKNNIAEKTTIKIGLLSGDFYEVLAGVNEGEEVVTKGIDKLKGIGKANVTVTRR